MKKSTIDGEVYSIPAPKTPIKISVIEMLQNGACSVIFEDALTSDSYNTECESTDCEECIYYNGNLEQFREYFKRAGLEKDINPDVDIEF